MMMSQVSPVATEQSSVNSAPATGQVQAGKTDQGQGATGQSSQNSSVINVMKPFKPTSNFNFKGEKFCVIWC